MLDEATRTAILRLRDEGHSVRWIARAMGVHRETVQQVIESGTAVPSFIDREERLLAHLDRVRELHLVCAGNLVRVQEELHKQGIETKYSTLTGFCRRHEIGIEPKERTGQYHFEPGEEMQHDTSPHDVVVGGKRRRMQCASLVLCFCRMKYVQIYRRWTRFHAKAFLSEAIQFFEGSAARCVVDNSSVLVAHGTGPDAVFAPDAVALGERLGFTFMACRLRDPNRKGRVERPFQDIEGNFYAGRTFADDADLNRQAREWCVAQNGLHRRRLKARPDRAVPGRTSAAVPLPGFVPEVYEVHQRNVDTEGFVNLHTNRYSVPDEVLGRSVMVHETLTRSSGPPPAPDRRRARAPARGRGRDGLAPGPQARGPVEARATGRSNPGGGGAARPPGTAPWSTRSASTTAAGRCSRSAACTGCTSTTPRTR